ncbi:MAG: hypothetical protein SGARI_001909 [Bacillariaceae sp.]
MVYDALESCDEESSTHLKLSKKLKLSLAQMLQQMPQQQSFFGSLLKQSHPRFLYTDKAFVEHFNTLANGNSNGKNMSKSVRNDALQTLCTAYYYLHQCHHWQSICFINLDCEWDGSWSSLPFTAKLRLQELLGQWEVRNYYAILALEKRLQENDVQVGGPEPDSSVDVLLEQLITEDRERLQKRRQKRNKRRKKIAKDDDGNTKSTEAHLIPF